MCFRGQVVCWTVKEVVVERGTNGRVPRVFTTRDVFLSPAVVSVLLVRLHSFGFSCFLRLPLATSLRFPEISSAQSTDSDERLRDSRSRFERLGFTGRNQATFAATEGSSKKKRSV